MPMTSLGVQGARFTINNKLTYAEIEGSPPQAHGLLMNARFIQGVFDDRAHPERFARASVGEWNAEANTDRLIAALPQWYAHGLRAITVGLQGGGPVFIVDDWSTIDNNPFGADGSRFDAAYAGRLDRLIRAADEVGMVIIVSFLYGSQSARLRDGRAVRKAVAGASRFLRDGGYTNVIIEVANEHNIRSFSPHPIVQSVEGIVTLMDLARSESGGLPVGNSGTGGVAEREVAEASDVILIHGNDCTRQTYYNLIKKVQSWQLDRPIVCNEDSPCIGQLAVANQTGTSWGYYNNPTKQDPPADWSITRGQDTYFARRMAESVGIPLDELPAQDHYYFQGFEPHMTVDGVHRWLHVAALYPEKVDYVEYYRNGELIDVAYQEPFYIDYRTTWIQGPVAVCEGDEWVARIVQADGEIVEKVVKV